MIYEVKEQKKAYSITVGIESVAVRPGGRTLSLDDLCQTIPKSKTGNKKTEPECVISPRLIDFFWNETLGDYDLSPY